MSFLLVVYAVLLIFLTLKRYRSIPLVVCVVLLLFTSTTVILLYGLRQFEAGQYWLLFGKNIERDMFIPLVAVLYAFDVACTVIIARNHIAYRKINKR